MYSKLTLFQVMDKGKRGQIALMVYDTIEMVEADQIDISPAEYGQLLSLREMFDYIAHVELNQTGLLDCIV